MLLEVTLSGVTLGGMYALVAMGLTLQYGVARIMNLSYGELLVAAAFAALWFYSGVALNPLVGLLIVPPVAFAASYAIYRFLMQPLVRRAATRDALEVDSILATFGLLFVIQGVMLAIFGGAYYSYSFLAVPLHIAGATVAANRLLALVLAVVIGLGLYLGLTRTRLGTAVRAVAVDPVAAQLVAIDVRTASALAFALGGALVAASGVLVSMFLTFNANLGVVFTLKALVVVIMGGVGNLLGALIAGLILGLVENSVAVFVDPGLTLAATYAIFLLVLLVRPQGILGQGRSMTAWPLLFGAAGVVGVAVLAGLPLVVGDYGLSLAINIVSYTVLATAWSLFSGPTRYVSLATVAFFGIGAYTTAVFVESLPWPLVLAIAVGVGSGLAAIVGLSTLRLSGVYFVIFSFGLAELVRQLVTWYEVNQTRTLGRYVFADVTAAQIYWQLLALAVLVFGAGLLIGRSRLGLALRAIGDDETVARHAGIDTTRAKVALFVFSTVFMTLTGAVMAPRWTYIDPAIAFNPVVSFTVLIMALLGGVHRLYGPVLGVVPLALLFEFLLARFPNHFSIMVGIVFILIVYVIPRGVVGLLEGAVRKPA